MLLWRSRIWPLQVSRPVLFILALVTAKACRGINAAAQVVGLRWPCLRSHNTHTETRTGRFSIRLHLRTKSDTVLMCGTALRGRILRCGHHKATQTVRPVRPCLLAEVNPRPVSMSLSDRWPLDGRKHMDSGTIDSGKRLAKKHKTLLCCFRDRVTPFLCFLCIPFSLHVGSVFFLSVTLFPLPQSPKPSPPVLSLSLQSCSYRSLLSPFLRLHAWHWVFTTRVV